MTAGLDKELGYIEEVEKEEKAAEKPRRRMFYEWEVGGISYRLKLPTSIVCSLEDKFKTNLINVISDDGIPSLSTMLTIVQGAISTYNHGIKYSDVQSIFDRYVDEGGNQISLYKDVILGVMEVSGFFMTGQAEKIKKSMEEAEMLM